MDGSWYWHLTREHVKLCQRKEMDIQMKCKWSSEAQSLDFKHTLENGSDSTQTIFNFEKGIALPETSIAYSRMFNFNSKIIHPPQTSRRMSETSWWFFVFGMFKSRDVMSYNLSACSPGCLGPNAKKNSCFHGTKKHMWSMDGSWYLFFLPTFGWSSYGFREGSFSRHLRDHENNGRKEPGVS